MRRKKHKRTRRIIRFYKIKYGFHEPFKVLVDGNFRHAMLQAKMKDPSELVPKLLGGSVKLFTTNCVLHELKHMGPDYKGTWRACKSLLIHKCNHEDKPLAAADCILEQVGDSNANHFFVATQDSSVRSAALKVPGGAVVNVSVNGLHLAVPSDVQKETAEQEEEDALHLTQEESKVLSKLAGGVKATGQPKTSAVFRKHKAKGPNPLSRLPKKRKAQQPAAGQHDSTAQPAGGTSAAGDKQEHKRPRRKKKTAGTADS